MQRRALLAADNGVLLSKENELKSGEVRVIFYHRMSLDCVILWIKVSLKHSRKNISLFFVSADPSGRAVCNGTATLEPEPTHDGKPTLVWTYIFRHEWLRLIRHVCSDFYLQKYFFFSVCLLLVSASDDDGDDDDNWGEFLLMDSNRTIIHQ